MTLRVYERYAVMENSSEIVSPTVMAHSMAVKRSEDESIGRK